MWETLFSITNLWALVGWAMLALLPRRPFVTSLVMYAVVGMLCLAYLAMFAGLLSGSVDPVADANPGGGAVMSLGWVKALFDSEAGTVIGWTHYLAFDLFVGLWIASDADRKGVHRAVQAPILLMTLLAGPIGLLIWLALREPAARRAARMGRSAGA
jgi:hypothetical protein